MENPEVKTINVNLIVYDIYDTTSGDEVICVPSKVLHGYYNKDDAVDYLDSLEETFRGYHNMKLDIDRPDDNTLTVSYDVNGKKNMNKYHIESTEIYYY